MLSAPTTTSSSSSSSSSKEGMQSRMVHKCGHVINFLRVQTSGSRAKMPLIWHCPIRCHASGRPAHQEPTGRIATATSTGLQGSYFKGLLIVLHRACQQQGRVRRYMRRAGDEFARVLQVSMPVNYWNCPVSAKAFACGCTSAVVATGRGMAHWQRKGDDRKCKKSRAIGVSMVTA